MAEALAGVLVEPQQSNEAAQREFQQLVSLVTAGEVKGVIFPSQPSHEANGARRGGKSMRRGALLGAGAGFLIGLVPLVASTMLAAGAGAMIAKASELRLEGGTRPRIHFGSGHD